MPVPEIRLALNALKNNLSLGDEKNFEARAEAIDLIDFELIGEIDTLLLNASQTDELISLKQHAEKLKAKLEQIDAALFNKLRENISAGIYPPKAFGQLINEYVSVAINDSRYEPDYDNLDLFINSLFPLQEIPEQTVALEPEMVYYQKTPARIIFELAAKADLKNDDIFFDLGSGLGQVTMLINLLTGVTAIGVEFEPAFSAYATANAATLNLNKVSFITADARQIDYSQGTVFFMFTPFKGEILHNVLDRLKKVSQHKKIRIITYGPCTNQVALENWLCAITPVTDNIYKLHVFNSV